MPLLDANLLIYAYRRDLQASLTPPLACAGKGEGVRWNH
jgi:hypothetical protein